MNMTKGIGGMEVEGYYLGSVYCCGLGARFVWGLGGYGFLRAFY